MLTHPKSVIFNNLPFVHVNPLFDLKFDQIQPFSSEEQTIFNPNSNKKNLYVEYQSVMHRMRQKELKYDLLLRHFIAKENMNLESLTPQLNNTDN